MVINLGVLRRPPIPSFGPDETAFLQKYAQGLFVVSSLVIKRDRILLSSDDHPPIEWPQYARQLPSLLIDLD